jgi:hypothetical protein
VLLALLALSPLLAVAGEKADLVVVRKSEATLYLQHGGQPFASRSILEDCARIAA